MKVLWLSAQPSKEKGGFNRLLDSSASVQLMPSQAAVLETAILKTASIYFYQAQVAVLEYTIIKTAVKQSGLLHPTGLKSAGIKLRIPDLLPAEVKTVEFLFRIYF